MRARLKYLIGSLAYKVEIATFHSFANSIIEDYPDSFPSIIGARPMDELERLEMLKQILENGEFELIKPLGDPMYYLTHISGILQDIKREGLNPDALEFLLKKQVEDFESIEDLTHTKGKKEGEMKGKYRTLEKKIKKNFELLTIYREYEKLKAESRVFDYDDAILGLLEALKHDNDLLMELQERFLYVLVDEHQDSNGAQNKIIEYITSFHDNPNLFIVGDDKQAIYRFQGASLENFLFFSKRYPNARIIELEENYRSSQHILDLSENLISNNPSLSTKPLKQAIEREEIKTIFTSCNSEIEEAMYVAKETERLLKEDSSKTIAVLYRNNKDASEIAAALERRKITYSKLSNTRSEIHPYTEQFLTLLSIAENPTDPEIARALLFNCFGLKVEEVITFLDGARKNKNTLSEESKINKKEVARVYKKILGLHKQTENDSFYVLFESVLHSTGLVESILSSSSAQEILSEIKGLHSLARSLEEGGRREITLSLFLSYIRAARAQNLLRIKITNTETNVLLSTVHKVKGLEFDTVFITGLENKHWGGKKKREYFYLPEFQGLSVGQEGEAEEDERRLLYVALTRTKERLILTNPHFGLDGKENMPSRFIEELGDEITRHEYLEDTLDFAEKRIEPNHSLLDKKYIQKLYFERSLNATAVNKYLACPWEYFFVTLLKFPQVPSPSAMFGTAIHSTLQIFFDARTSGKDLSVEETISTFQQALDSSRLTENEKLRYLKRGKEALRGYIENHKNSWPQKSETERSIRDVELKIGDFELRLSGKLDKIVTSSEGLIVTDFKTGKPKSRNELEGKTKTGTGDYKRQLTFYSLLLLKNGEKMKEGVIDFVEPNERGKYKQEHFVVTEEERDELIQTIEQMTSDIISLDFTQKGCQEKTCDWCRLSESLFI